MFSDPQKNVSAWSLPLGAIVADFGSGSGHYVRAISKAVGSDGKVLAVDIQKDLLSKLKNEVIKEGLENIEVIWGDLETPNGSHIKSGSLDALVISNLLFQVKSKEAIAKEALRVLKPHGSLLLVDWADSFGGFGPKTEDVFSKEKALPIFQSVGFSFLKDVDAGAHHYGVILEKASV
jgi:ubiquinone/menaquinone biosynthesis C-methylase UbiE